MAEFRVLVTARPPRETASEEYALLRGAGAEIVETPDWHAHSAAQLRDLLPGVDAVWATVDAYTEDALAAADRLKLVARWGVGIETIDLDAATRAGVIISNTPGFTTDSVADYTFGLILNVARKQTQAHNQLRGGEWRQVWGVNVCGKTLGLVGFGNIGRGVARRARGFEMTIVAYDPYADPAQARDLGVQLLSLREVIVRADFLSLHASLTADTRRMIGEAELALMKPDAFLINCGRGELMDTQALVSALRAGRIAGAALDVYDPEPPPPDHPLLSLPNCLTLPHSASWSAECARAINRENSESILAVMRGQAPRFVCNPAVLTSGRCRALAREAA